MLQTLVVALGVLALSPRPAAACHDGYQITRAMFAIGALAVDTPLVIHDLVVDRSSRGYGVAEAVLTAPQMIIGMHFISEGGRECEEAGGTLDDQSGGSGYTSVVIVASAALFAHAIYVIVTPRTSTSRAKPNKAPSIGFAPILVTDREQVAGLTLGFTF